MVADRDSIARIDYSGDDGVTVPEDDRGAAAFHGAEPRWAGIV